MVSKQQYLEMIEERNPICELYGDCDNSYSQLNIDYDIGPIETGATKEVIILTNEDYVLKIPYAGNIEYIDDCTPPEGGCENLECCECEFKENKENIIIFDSANSLDFSEYNIFLDNDDWNYCEVELQVYEISKILDIDKCFAAIEYIGDTKYGLPVYTQEKAEKIGFYDVNEDELDKNIKKTIEDLSSRGQTANQFFQKANGLIVLSEFLKYHGLEKFLKLMDFIKNIGLNDLHMGNFGIMSDGRPVLIDYSGYFENGSY